MWFRPLLPGDEENKTALAEEYRAAKKYSKLSLGAKRLFFRAGLRTYYVPYGQVTRCFRRVQLVPIKAGGQDREIRLENMVLCGEQGELVQLRLADEKEAKRLLEDLKKRMPEAQFGKPAAAEPAETTE